MRRPAEPQALPHASKNRSRSSWVSSSGRLSSYRCWRRWLCPAATTATAAATEENVAHTPSTAPTVPPITAPMMPSRSPRPPPPFLRPVGSRR